MPDRLSERLVHREKLAAITTTGHKSGLERVAYVNYSEAPDGGYYVAAAGDADQWAKNLQARAHCRLRIGHVDVPYSAQEVSEDERGAVVASLKPRFTGERVDLTGPAFHLVPVPTD